MPRNGQDRNFNVNIKKANFGGDPSDYIATQQRLYIDFFHVPSKNSMAFKAFITEYSETYELNYDTVDTFGRMDAFTKYKNTRRRISLAWETVAASEAEAQQNVLRCSELIQMMYPSYESSPDIKGVNFITDNPVFAAPPTFRIRFANWLVDSKKGTPGLPGGPGAFIPADFSGVLCFITNFQYAPDLEQGSFDTKGGVFPKVIKLNCAITPKMPEGHWDNTTKKKVGDFRYFPFGHDGLDPSWSGGISPEQSALNDEKNEALQKTQEEEISRWTKSLES